MTAQMISFDATRFQPTPDELNEEADDFINPDVFGKELSIFLSKELAASGFEVSFACAEDWGWYHEIDHDEPFALVFGCSNYGDGHLVQFSPKTEHVRKMFKKYHAAPKVDALRGAIWKILENAEGVSNLRYEED